MTKSLKFHNNWHNPALLNPTKFLYDTAVEATSSEQSVAFQPALFSSIANTGFLILSVPHHFTQTPQNSDIYIFRSLGGSWIIRAAGSLQNINDIKNKVLYNLNSLDKTNLEITTIIFSMTHQSTGIGKH